VTRQLSRNHNILVGRTVYILHTSSTERHKERYAYGNIMSLCLLLRNTKMHHTKKE